MHKLLLMASRFSVHANVCNIAVEQRKNTRMSDIDKWVCIKYIVTDIKAYEQPFDTRGKREKNENLNGESAIVS